MRIEVYSDTVCPWCFIGKRRFEKALALWPEPVAVDWRAFQLNPDMPAGGMDRGAYLSAKFGGEDRARRIYSLIAQNGRREDIDFRFDRVHRTPNTLDSHKLIRFASRAGKQDTVVEALFRAYFLKGVDIGSLDRILSIAAEAGLDPESVRAHLASEDGTNEVLAEDRRARRMGVDGVPCFIINGQYALAGAQEPQAFLPLFELVKGEPRLPRLEPA